MTMTPKILVIVVTFNGLKWLDKCLGSLRLSTIAADTFIIDNCSSDNSVEYIKSHYPEAFLIESDHNLGFGKANNIGLKYAVDNNYDYVYLLNQDAWIESDTLEKLINISQLNTEFGILSPLQVNCNKSALDYNFANWCPKKVVSDALCSKIKPLYEVDFIMAAHWLISRKALLTVGGFSPTFPHYGEDDNYLHRLHFHGLKVGIVTTSMGVHDREFRPFPKEKVNYMEYIQLLVELSKPTCSISKRILKTIVRKSIGLPSPQIKYIYQIIKNLGAIKKNRKLSLKNEAFL